MLTELFNPRHIRTFTHLNKAFSSSFPRATMVVSKYMDAEDLAALIKSESSATVEKKYAIVDVRDSDFRGGNIPGCFRLPSREANAEKYAQLAVELKDKEHVVFHCVMSQVRGPKAATRYAEALAKAYPESKQEVHILREGFAGFQSKYRKDPELVEKFIKAAWD